jgi:hypothetical protein
MINFLHCTPSYKSLGHGYRMDTPLLAYPYAPTHFLNKLVFVVFRTPHFSKKLVFPWREIKVIQGKGLVTP